MSQATKSAARVNSRTWRVVRLALACATVWSPTLLPAQRPSEAATRSQPSTSSSRPRIWSTASAGLGVGGAECAACTRMSLGVQYALAAGLQQGTGRFGGAFIRGWEGGSFEVEEKSLSVGAVVGTPLLRTRWLGVVAHGEIAREHYRRATYPEYTRRRGTTVGGGVSLSVAPRWALSPTVQAGLAIPLEGSLGYRPRLFAGLGLVLR